MKKNEAGLSRPNVVLASDLDGTLIPLAHDDQHHRDLGELAMLLDNSNIPLLYVTGRHLESVLVVADAHGLPRPAWVICDVGSAIYACHDESFRRNDEYATHLRELLGQHNVSSLHERLSDLPGLTRQEEEKQTEFKLSYYTTASERMRCTQEIQQLLVANHLPFSVISSLDPFEQRGLIDLLPRDVSKAYALRWWCEQNGFDREQIIYAGDSGNDSAAFAAGYRAIIVGNADDQVVAEARAAHAQQGWKERLYTAKKSATSGVLEGVLHFVA
jgi:HAD superfamily hydrolase (TIGR01484 family)